jgi:hypothetical protein
MLKSFKLYIEASEASMAQALPMAESPSMAQVPPMTQVSLIAQTTYTNVLFGNRKGPKLIMPEKFDGT